MATQWYFQVMGQVMGPVDARILKDRVRAGDIGRETLVRKGEDGEWILAERIADLFPPLAPPRFDENVPVPPRAADATAPAEQPGLASGAPAGNDTAVDVAEAGSGKKRNAKAARRGDGLLMYALFDCRFRRLVAPRLVSIVQLVVIIAACLMPIWVFVTTIQVNLIAAVIATLVAAISSIISILFSRLLLECVLILFRIASLLGGASAESGSADLPVESSVS